MKTCFQNLFYLEKALNRLNIIAKQKQVVDSQFSSVHTNLIISQPNNHDIEFCWNGNEYNLVVDLSFWQQDVPTNQFMDRIAQKYASESIVGESQKIGFQPINYQQTTNGSAKLTLERWNLLKNFNNY
jgi:hypothetical protein